MSVPAMTRNDEASDTTFGSVRIVVSSSPMSWVMPAQHDEAVLVVATSSPPRPDSGFASRADSVAYFVRGRTPVSYAGEGRQVLQLTFPLEVLDGINLQAGGKHAIDTTSALFWPLLVFARTLVLDAAKRTPLATYYTERLLQEMIAGVAVASLQLSPGHLAFHPYGAAMSMITASVGDPSLTPARLASDLNVSLRTLQRQFSSRGTTIERAIRSARVAEAMGLLSNPDYDALSINRIAHACGLSNGSSLARAFAAEGLPSPAVARKGARRQSRIA